MRNWESLEFASCEMNVDCGCSNVSDCGWRVNGVDFDWAWGCFMNNEITGSKCVWSKAHFSL